MKYKIGENIVKCRKLNGMTQRYLAKSVGISVQGLLKIEKGLVNPKVETLDKIIKILCITPNQLFGMDSIDEDKCGLSQQLRNLKETNNEAE
jgi:Predicted transcriptional regulators